MRLTVLFAPARGALEAYTLLPRVWYRQSRRQFCSQWHRNVLLFACEHGYLLLEVVNVVLSHHSPCLSLRVVKTPQLV